MTRDPDLAKQRSVGAEGPSPPKKAKRTFVQRLFRPFELVFQLGTVLVTEPRSFPRAFAIAFRHGFRAVWNARGGGLYAVGFFVTFLWLEMTMFIDDVAEASGVGDFITSQLFELFIRYTIESLVNTLRAFLWPLYVLQFQPPIGLLLLGAAFLLFPRFVKPTLERWLFDQEQTDVTTEDKGD